MVKFKKRLWLRIREVNIRIVAGCKLLMKVWCATLPSTSPTFTPELAVCYIKQRFPHWTPTRGHKMINRMEKQKKKPISFLRISSNLCLIYLLRPLKGIQMKQNQYFWSLVGHLLGSWGNWTHDLSISKILATALFTNADMISHMCSHRWHSICTVLHSTQFEYCLQLYVVYLHTLSGLY